MMDLTDEQLASLARASMLTQYAELSCDKVNDLLAAYIEAGDKATTPMFEAVAAHLRICPECTQEHLALLEAMQAENGE